MHYVNAPVSALRLFVSCIILVTSACAKLPVSGFKPVYPEQRLSDPTKLEFATVSWPEVDSLTPTLRWEPFPGTHEKPAFQAKGSEYLSQDGNEADDQTSTNSSNVKNTATYSSSMKDITRDGVPVFVEEESLTSHLRWPFIEIDDSKVENIEYDLRIWERSNLGQPVYEINRVPQTSYTITRALKPGSYYLWTVRARFRINGKPRISEWSMLNDWRALQFSSLRMAAASLPKGCINPSWGFYLCTPRYVAEIEGTIRPNFYYRFRTPAK